MLRQPPLWDDSETNFNLTNAQLRLEWYDGSVTNKVQADSVTNLTIPNDNTWHEYWLTGSCTDDRLYEIRPTVEVVWGRNDLGVDPRALMMENARLLPDAYEDQNSLIDDWAYHSGVDMKASREYVPQTNVGPFLQVDYATTSATMYVLANYPSQAKYYPEEDGVWAMRTSWVNPTNTSEWLWYFEDMTRVGTIDIGDTTETFHGLPASGSKTLELWKYTFHFPCDTNGIPYTNVTICYGAYFKSTNESQKTDDIYLVGSDGSKTNNLGQQLDPDIVARDYTFTIHYNRSASLLNDSFETPVSNNFENTGWGSWGLAARDGWAAHSGDLGASFHSWDPGDAGIWQDVAVTGGTYTFSIWARAETGCNPTNLALQMEWYDTADNLIRVDNRDYKELPHDSLWHPLYITATCTSNSIYYVRPIVTGVFNSPTGSPTAISLDDCRFYQGSYTGVPSLANGGFELRTTDDGWRGSQWATWPEIDSVSNRAGMRPGWDWVRHSGSRGIWLTSSTNDGTASASYNTTLTQILVPGTGTYTFSIWMKQEANFYLNDIRMSLQWYDETFTNKVQTDTETNLTSFTPLSSTWTRYDVIGTCTDTNLYEVRLNLYAQWDVYDYPMDQKSMMIDDARFVRGTYPQNLIDLDWAYFNNTNTADPSVEQVPGTNVGTFLDVNYARTTTTFYVLTRNPTFAVYPEETNNVEFRLYYSDWQGLAGEVITNMSPMGPVVLLDSARFHELPATGSETVNLWKVEWSQPLNTNDFTPSTNRFDVWFSPILRTYYNGQMTEERWLVNSSSLWTNNYPTNPQLFGISFSDADWHYYNQRPPADTNYTDGIPDTWWSQYGIAVIDRIGTNNPDSDGADNNEEYVADTDPTDPNSVFLNTITNYISETNRAYGQGYILRIMAGPPTTNSRQYDVYWKTNLKNNAEGWTGLLLNVPGDDAGGPVMLIITNNATNRFYRTGVKIPE